MKFFRLNYFQKIILGFASLILLGAILLMLPISSNDGVYTPFLNALFTSTSASCVTGLIVYDTATHWSFFGQAVILFLIQIGGLLCYPSCDTIYSRVRNSERTLV